jgi:hypothetical protein
VNQEIKDQWLAALRSGKYKQGHGALQVNDMYCCLGVLCAISPFADEAQMRPDGSVYYIETSESGYRQDQEGILPRHIKDWAGLESRNPSASHSTLASLNDQGATFEEIADIIEREL